VTLRVHPELPSLASSALRGHVDAALRAGADRFGLQLLSYSARKGTLELRVKPADRRALARGIQGLSIRVARAVNRQLKRKGRLFVDRYEARAVET